MLNEYANTRGTSESVSFRKPFPTLNTGTSWSSTAATNITVTLVAGGAGTVGAFRLNPKPILNQFGYMVGKFGDTSVTMTSTALLTEVNIANDKADVDLTAQLLNGQYYIYYPEGVVYYKKADSSTSMTISWLYATATGAGGGGGGTTTSQGTYNSTAPTLANGQTGSLQLDSNGNLKVVEQFVDMFVDNTRQVAATALRPLASSVYSWNLFSNASFQTVNIKTTTGNINSLNVLNNSAGLRYIQIFNTASTPATGATPLYSFVVPSSSSYALGNDFFGLNGANLSSGIAIANSTTPTTYTAGTAGDLFAQFLYI